MNLYLFSIHDQKAEIFMTPFVAPNAATAKRSFAHAANDPNSDICRFPGDFTLFELGSFNGDTAELTPLKTPKNLGLASTFKTQDSAADAGNRKHLGVFPGGATNVIDRPTTKEQVR